MKQLHEFIDEWNKLNPDSNAFQRVDAEHPLNFYIGQNTSMCKQLLLISNDEPFGLAGSKSIGVEIGKRHDGHWSITFTLNKKEHEQLFITLCFDIVESSRTQSNSKAGITHVIKRFLKWQQLMAHAGDGLLSPEAEKGLFGELLFLKECLEKGMVPLQAVESWIGCEKADRDFVFENNWAEIKTINPDAVSVAISSLEQLDAPNEGDLVVFFAEKTAPGDRQGQTLNELVALIRTILSQHTDALHTFNCKLIVSNFQDSKRYDENRYVCRSVKRFAVKQDFPKLTRRNVPISVLKLSYELGLSTLGDWEKSYE